MGTSSKDWTAQDFQRVIYSEECSAEKEPAGQQIWGFSHTFREVG